MKKRVIITIFLIGAFLLSTLAVSGQIKLGSIGSMQPSSALQVQQPSIQDTAFRREASSEAELNLSVQMSTAQQSYENVKDAAENAPEGYVMLFKCSKSTQNGINYLVSSAEGCMQEGYKIVSEPGEFGYAFADQELGGSTVPLRVCSFYGLNAAESRRTAADYLLPAEEGPWETRAYANAQVQTWDWRYKKYDGSYSHQNGDDNIISTEGRTFWQYKKCIGTNTKIAPIGYITQYAGAQSQPSCPIMKPRLLLECVSSSAGATKAIAYGLYGQEFDCPASTIDTPVAGQPIGWVFMEIPGACSETVATEEAEYDPANCVDNAFHSKESAPTEWPPTTPAANLETKEEILARIQQAEAMIQDTICKNKCLREQFGSRFVEDNCEASQEAAPAAAPTEEGVLHNEVFTIGRTVVLTKGETYKRIKAVDIKTSPEQVLMSIYDPNSLNPTVTSQVVPNRATVLNGVEVTVANITEGQATMNLKIVELEEGSALPEESTKITLEKGESTTFLGKTVTITDLKRTYAAGQYRQQRPEVSVTDSSGTETEEIYVGEANKKSLKGISITAMNADFRTNTATIVLEAADETSDTAPTGGFFWKVTGMVTSLFGR